MKVVINCCYGRFGLSTRAYERLIELGMKVVPHFEGSRDDVYIIKLPGDRGLYLEGREVCKIRSNPLLVAVVEELGEGVNTSTSYLCIVDVPDEVDWVIEEYDGNEWVSERHRTWMREL